MRAKRPSKAGVAKALVLGLPAAGLAMALYAVASILIRGPSGNADGCRERLRVCWVVAHAACRERGLRYPPPLEEVRAFIASRDYVARGDEARYVYPEGSFPNNAIPLGLARMSLLCPGDPEFVAKFYSQQSQMLSTLVAEPSYYWTPGPGILARCPYHHFDLLDDGTITEQ